jgi:predicted alpha/beta hydrolase
LCAWTLARAHARSGDRIAIAAYLGSDNGFVRAMSTFATSYADLAERDHARFREAVEADPFLGHPPTR